MHKVINIINYTGMTALFLWISFFAPLVGGLWWFQFPFILIISLLIVTCLHAKSYKLIFSREALPFWIFLLAMMGGLVNIKDSQVAYQHFWHYIYPIPFIYFFAKAAFQKKHGLFMMRALCFMALLVCIFGIIEFITRQNFIYSYFIENMFYDVFRGHRMMSTHVHAVPLGTYLTAIFPLSVILALREKKSFFKFIYIVNASIIFISIVLSFSRGAFLGVFVAISIMLVFLSRRKKMFFLILIAVIAIIFAYWTYAAYLKNIFYDKLAPDNSLGFYRYSLQGLIDKSAYFAPRFKMCIDILKDHPFLGVAFGHYRVWFDHYLPDLARITGYDCKVADSMYMTLVAETGLIGFAGFILFIFFHIKNIWNRLKLVSEYENKLLIVGFLSGFAGILCTFLTYEGLYWTAPNYLFWSYAGILSSQLE